MTPADETEVEKFAEFLRIAGPPDGRARQRLVDAGRADLLDWALGISAPENVECRTCGDEVLIAGEFGVDPLGIKRCPDCTPENVDTPT
jgi:hypothetical protein